MIDINTITLEQAKAYAYDVLVRIETEQKNLQILNQVIAQKSRPETIEPEQEAVG